MSSRVFISYGRANREDADQLAQRLRARGVATWLDDTSPFPGDEWRLAVEQSLDAADAVVLLVGRDQQSPEVRSEWSMVQEVVWKQPDKRLIPVILGDVESPAFLRSRPSIRITGKSRDWELTATRIKGLLSGDTPAENGPSKEDIAAYRTRLEEVGAAAKTLDAEGRHSD